MDTLNCSKKYTKDSSLRRQLQTYNLVTNAEKLVNKMKTSIPIQIIWSFENFHLSAHNNIWVYDQRASNIL